MDEDALKQVPKFQYLCTEDGKNKEDVIQRIKEDKFMFNNKKHYSGRKTLIWK
jgi:predicted nucleic acid-binding Zn ribbon protein